MSIVRALVNYDEMLESYLVAGETAQTPATNLLYQNPRDIICDEVKVLYSTMARQAAPFNRRGAVARVIDKNGKGTREAAVFVQFNKQTFSHDVFMAVLNDENGRVIEAKTATEVQFQTEHARVRHKMSKEAVSAAVLSGRTIYFDQNGDVRLTTDNTYDAVTFGFLPANQSQLNVDGSGDVVDISWDDEDALILDQLDDLDEKNEALGRPPITRVICPVSMKRNLRLNKQVADWVKASPTLSEQALRGNVIEDLGGKRFEFWSATFQTVDGASHKVVPDGRAIFMPESPGSWCQPLRGLTPVPTSIEVGKSIESLQEVYGEFAYTKMSEDPVGLDSYMGDVFGYCVTAPEHIYQATVVFGG